MIFKLEIIPINYKEQALIIWSIYVLVILYLFSGRRVFIEYNKFLTPDKTMLLLFPYANFGRFLSMIAASVHNVLSCIIMQ